MWKERNEQRFQPGRQVNVGQSLCDYNSQRLGVILKQNKLTSSKTAGCCLAAAVLLFHLLEAEASHGSFVSTD